MSDYPLKPHEWPIADQLLWQRLIVPVSVLDDGGELSHLSQDSLLNAAVAYGRWLAWLAENQPTALKEPPMGRITPYLAQGWLVSIGHLAPSSRKMWVDGLIRVITGTDPNKDIVFLRRAQQSLLGLAQEDHGDRKIGRIPSSFDLINAALDYAEADVGAATSAFEQTRRLRDAAMIVLLAMLPIRRKNFVALEIGRTFQVHDDKIIVSLPAAEVKTKSRYVAEVQEPGAALMRRYLSEARPVLAARTERVHESLWLADTGLPYSYGYIGRRIPLISERLLGIKVPPHFFRDAIATTFARTSPELARGTKAILGHAGYTTAERHYNQARALEAGRTYAEIIEFLIAADRARA